MSDKVNGKVNKEEKRFISAVITLSDKGFAGEREDKSGPLISQMLSEAGYQVKEQLILPDEQEQLEGCLCRLADEESVDVIFTTGGTGFWERDRTPEATLAVCDRMAPGIAGSDALVFIKHYEPGNVEPGRFWIRKKTLIINLPGSPKAVRENLEYILPALGHGLGILCGTAGECGNEN